MATISKSLITDKINGITVNTSIKAKSTNYTNCSSRDVKYVVMHYTANQKDTAKSNANYFSNGSRQASAHFFVDNTTIYQSVELRDRAWHCGTSGTYYHASCRNTNSIGVEMCTSGSAIVSDQTQINASYLCAYLCKMVGITSSTVDSYVLRHYDVTHKNCPAQFVSNSAQWTNFKTMVKNILNTGNHKGTVASQAPAPTAPTTTTTDSAYTTFVKGVQSACGATVDGKAGTQTLSKTVTVSATKNNRHAVVKVLQTYFNALGYNCGVADGCAGAKFTAAAIAYQKANGCTADGEVTAKGLTWKKLLKLA